MGRDKSLELRGSTDPCRVLDPFRPPWQHLPRCNFLQNWCKLGEACPHPHDDTRVVYRRSRTKWCTIGLFGCGLNIQELHGAHYAAKPLLDLVTGTWACLWQLGGGKITLVELNVEPHHNSRALRACARVAQGISHTLNVRYSAARKCVLCRHYVLDVSNSTVDALIWRDSRFPHVFSQWDRRSLSAIERRLLIRLCAVTLLTFEEAFLFLEWATIEPFLGSLVEYLARRSHLFWIRQGVVFLAPSLLRPMLCPMASDTKAPPIPSLLL